MRTAYAQYIPSLSVSGSGSRQGGETFFQGQLVPYRGSPWSFSRGLPANLELFDGGRRWYNLRAAEANVDAADASETAQRYNIALQVKQQYFSVLAARESEAAARRQLEQAGEQLKSSTAKVRAGAATKSDSLRSAIQVGNARLALLTAQNNLRVANAGLSRLVGAADVRVSVGKPTVANAKVMAEVMGDAKGEKLLILQAPQAQGLPKNERPPPALYHPQGEGHQGIRASSAYEIPKYEVIMERADPDFAFFAVRNSDLLRRT